ncbi:MAG: hypothetical protein HRT88_16500, partial [Lentisphaeraceae bacterium]|nr:hypothetical protein [Lentisphaeraceae bacterium]
VLDGGRAAVPTNNAVELYDLQEDIGEHKNLASQNPEVRDMLLTELISWHGTVKAPIPTEKNPAYDPSAKKAKKGKKGNKGKKNKKK